jgi:energy-coupling factor transport system ATP-binding protein
MGHTVMIITHDVNLVAKHAARTILMGNGKILFDGPTRSAFDDPSKLKEAYVKPPQVTQLSIKLKPIYGFSENMLTPEDMIVEMKNKLKLK